MKRETTIGIRNGRVLTDDGFIEADILILDETIVGVGPGVAANSADCVDAAGAWVLPGAVDAHVHFNEPGRTQWEGFASGSCALAAGGTTCFIDMPLNAAPPTIDRASFELKRMAGEANSCLDFALWGGLIPGNRKSLPELAECGVVGFKAFMISSGMDDFPGVDADVLREGMQVAGSLGLPVAVHAEDSATVRAAAEIARRDGASDAAAFLASRPREAEMVAAGIALDLAGETGCSVHIVHAGCPEVVHLVHAARALGVDATVEVCYHHALLDASATDLHGVMAKCAPPLRDASARRALGELILRGGVDSVGSDHSPAPPEMKLGRTFWDAWGGIMGCQHGLLLLADHALAMEGEPGLATVWAAASSRPAQRWGLSDRKGRIAPGCHADIVLIARCPSAPIQEQELLYRHKTSPYVGMALGLSVRALCLRGIWKNAFAEGLPAGGAKFLTRST